MANIECDYKDAWRLAISGCDVVSSEWFLILSYEFVKCWRGCFVAAYQSYGDSFKDACLCKIIYLVTCIVCKTSACARHLRIPESKSCVFKNKVHLKFRSFTGSSSKNHKYDPSFVNSFMWYCRAWILWGWKLWSKNRECAYCKGGPSKTQFWWKGLPCIWAHHLGKRPSKLHHDCCVLSHPLGLDSISQSLNYSWL